jgi:hypothetical protein
MTEATEPTNIIWENLDSIESGMKCSKGHQFGYKVLALVMISFFLVVCFSAIVYLKKESVHDQLRYPPMTDCG